MTYAILIIIGLIVLTYLVIIVAIAIQTIFGIDDDKEVPDTSIPQLPPREPILPYDLTLPAIRERNGVLVGKEDPRVNKMELEFLHFYEANTKDVSAKFLKKNWYKFGTRAYSYSLKILSELDLDMEIGDARESGRQIADMIYRTIRKRSERANTDLTIPYIHRNRHVYLAGRTRSGKSNLIKWLAYQDIVLDNGVCVIDPAGDLVEDLLHYIPENRVNDAVYIDGTTNVTIDFMGYSGDLERDVLAGDLLITFKRFSEGWGERMESILRYTINTLLLTKNPTFLDIYYFLTDKKFRDAKVLECPNEDLKAYWKTEFDKHGAAAVLPITSRMSKFLLTPSLKAMLGSRNPNLNIFDHMQKKGILLVNLARVGQETANLLGTLLVSKIQQSAMRRHDPTERVPCYCYVDEFENFQTSAFDVILSQAAKFQLCLTLANQFVDQLDAKIKASILGNVGTLILFNLNEKDANTFKGEIAPVDPRDLIRMEQGRALYRPAVGKAVFVTTPTPQPSPASYAQIIKKRMVDKSSSQPSPNMVQSKKDEPDDRDEGKPTLLPDAPKVKRAGESGEV